MRSGFLKIQAEFVKFWMFLGNTVSKGVGKLLKKREFGK